MKMDEKIYKDLVENHPQPMMVLDSTFGDILHVNKSALAFYGYSLDEFKSMKISDINQYSEEEVMIEIQAAKKENRNYFTFTHKVKDGTIKKVQVYSYPVNIGEQSVLFTMVISKKQDQDYFDEDTNSMIRRIDDAVCLVKENYGSLEQIVTTSIAFDRLMEMDMKTIQSMSLDSIVQLDDGYTFFSMDSEGSLSHPNHNRWIPVKINSMPMRLDGERCHLLVFKPQKFHSKNDIDIQLKDLTSFEDVGKGYLININLYLNINNERRYSKLTECVKGHIKHIFQTQNISYKMMALEGKIIIHSSHTLSEIYACLSMLFEIQPSEQSLNACESKLRIGISNFDHLNENQVITLNSIMKSFEEFEFNEIHTFSKKKSYSKALEIKTGLDHAIQEDEFDLYAQAIVDISENRIDGYEMLLRWNNPKYGIIMPNDFIPYAELTGKIVDIDYWVIEHTFEFLREQKKSLEGLIFHINISTKTLSNRKFIRFIHEHMHGIKAENIVFEITEDQAIGMMDLAIAELRHLGFMLAIDDFGKGYSSFERIKNIGIQYVKIDKSFITGLTDNVDDVLILKAIISMCNNLNIKVIAEGIEKIEQLEFLYARKCYMIQGFIFSRPKNIMNLVTQHHALNEHVDVTVNQLLSNEIASKKFYNRGRIILQDIDENYNFITPNVTLADILDYEFADFVEMTFLDMIPAQYKKMFQEFVSRISHAQDFDAIMIQLLDKHQKPLKVICAINKTRVHYRLYIEFLDKVNEKEMELLGLSHSYLQAFDEAPSGMTIVSDSFAVSKWNISCESIFGYELKDVKNKNIIKLLSDESKQRDMNHLFNNAIKAGRNEMVIENINQAGETIICRWHISAIFDDLEQTHQYICIVNDITESIKKSRELSRVNKALDQSKSIIIMTDVDGTIEYVNQKFEEVTGYTSEEAIGENPRLLASGEATKEFYKELWTTILNGEVWEGEFHNKRKSGGFYWAKVNIYPISENDEITGFVGIQNDITNEKDLVNQNTNLKNKLFEQDKVASLGLLSSGIMHEINNPLSYIQGNIKYIIELFEDFESLDKDDIDDLKDAFSDIDKGVTQIKDIAEGLKKYIFKGGLDEKEEVNLVEEIKTVLMLAKNEYKYHANIHFNYIEEVDYKVIGFGSKLKQVFMNLIINAAHAIAAAEKDGLGAITIDLINSPSDVILKFSDDGCGMDKSTVEKIYEPLFTTKEEGIGSGLGLSVSRQIIEEEHDGSIVCESEVDVGTTFTIRLKRG